jgi:uncharacterized protein
VKPILKLLAYIFLGVVILWAIVTFLVTTPVVGNHPGWRKVWVRPQDLGLKAQEVSFLSRDGIPLKAWFLPAQGASHGTIILVHGIDGNRSDMLPRAAFLVHGGYNVLDVDLRDHGGSGGNYASPGYLESRDILGAVSYLRRNGQMGPLVAMGHSYGAVAALWAATQSPDISAVIADSSYLSLDSMIRHATLVLSEDPQMSFWVRMGLHLAHIPDVSWTVLPMFYLRTGVWVNLAKTNTISAIRQIGSRPILFISGQLDPITSPEGTRRMYDAAISPEKMLLIVPGADHDSTYKTAPDLYGATVLRFLKKVFPT